jgi:hypothetical protein
MPGYFTRPPGESMTGFSVQSEWHSAVYPVKLLARHGFGYEEVFSPAVNISEPYGER